MQNKQKHQEVLELIEEKLKKLDHNEEDKKLINKLIDAYFRKRTRVSNSKIKITATAILWTYSKMNYLWENNQSWTRQSLADLFNAKAKTTGDKASEISKTLKIRLWDDRFCRKEVAEGNPMKDLVMTISGAIAPKDMAIQENIPFAPLKKGKEDYYYDGLDFLEEGELNKAKRCFKKALEMDDEYVDAYNGLGNIYYFSDNLEKAKEYYQKAYELTKKYFNNKWPASLEWGILENRQYLRSIHNLGLVLWKENKPKEAKELFMLILRLNNNDNQGARYLVAAILKGLTWEKFGDLADKCIETGNYEEEENLFVEQNKIHQFYQYKGS